MEMPESYVVGIDVGGTNTDTAILQGSTVIAKAKSLTTKDKTHGIVNSLQAALKSVPANPGRGHVLANLLRVSIGTTHFVNAVTERAAQKLKKVAVIRLCGSASRDLPPFADFPKDLAALVDGGKYMLEGGLEYDAKREISSLNEDELKSTIRCIIQQDPPIRNVVISGVFSPCDNPKDNQELRALTIAKQVYPDISCTLSYELGMLGILERENAAVLNESLKSLASITIKAFEEALLQLNIKCPFYLTQNDGTLISGEEAMRHPVLTFSSGPTNSMRGASFLSGIPNAIVVDIGGTTTDVGVLKNGFPREASGHCKVGGDVRTNFCMPDLLSIAIGGGTCVRTDASTEGVSIGPGSVAYRFTSEALCYGGEQCTLTDVAMAAGVAPPNIGKGLDAVRSVSASVVYSSMRQIRIKIEAAIDSMKTEREDVPVLLVGGGSILVDCVIPLKGASKVIVPSEHWDVANAVGAALGTVGGAVDYIVNLAEIKDELRTAPRGGELTADELEKKARDMALERGRESAKSDVINNKSAMPETVYIHSEDVSDVTYVNDRVRVKVKAIGALMRSDVQTLHQVEPVEVSDVLSTALAPSLNLSEIMKEQLSKDNPFWPNSSAEDKALDEVAGLPPARVTEGGGEWELSEKDVECLAIGAGILGCGGGGDPHAGRLRALQQLDKGKKIKIINPCRVDPSSMGRICGVALMGAPVILIEKLCSGNETLLSLQRLRQVVASGVCEGKNAGRKGNEKVRVEEKVYTCPMDGSQFPVWLANDDDLLKIDVNDPNLPLHRRITALICCEAGGLNSIEPLLAGAATGLPVMDVDGMGRAFPELQMFVPFMYGLHAHPASLADNKGEVITCTHIGSSVELEKFFRVETVRMGMSSGVALALMTYKEMLEKCILFTMSQAWQLGRAIMRARVQHTNIIETVITQQKGMVLLTGKVIRVDRVSGAGFTTVESLVEGLDNFAGYQLKVEAKNENYIARCYDISSGTKVDGPVLACTPDLITIVDSDTGDPITTEAVRYGMRVGIVVLPANPMLKTVEAMKFVGPTAFGFHVPYMEPHPIQGQD